MNWRYLIHGHWWTELLVGDRTPISFYGHVIAVCRHVIGEGTAIWAVAI